MPKLFVYRGTRIYPRDQQLIFNWLLSIFLAIFVPFLGLIYWKQLRQINFKTFSWPAITALNWQWSGLIVAALISVLGFSIFALGFYHFRYDSFKQLQHRQKLAKMMIENNWYESSSGKNDSFFKDLGSSSSKEKIDHFPRIYYRLKDGLIHVSVEIVMSSYQDQLLRLERKLESGLYCEMVDKVLHDSYVEYTLLYDTIANRINIDDVVCHDGEMTLMKTVSWKYDDLPHMLIAGGTGGGKTYFIMTLIQSLIKTGAQLTILDPKNADLADLEAVMPDVHSTKESMIAALNQFYEEMMTRNAEMKKMDGYKTGENYAYVGLPAHFLVFDEFVAFMDSIGRESAQAMSKLKQIVMLGRQSGYFLILACQRPDAKYLGEGVRDQFMFRVALGRMSDLGYNMMFGETDKDFFQKPIRGRGYVDVGTSVISEFYTPLVPKGYNFLDEIEAAELSAQ